MHRGVEVDDGHQRFDAVAGALVEHRVIEGQAFLVGLLVVPVGEDAGPGDGHAEALESHLGHQGDVFLVMVVEVDSLMGGVDMVGVGGQHGHAAGGHRKPVLAGGDDIVGAKSLAALLPGALALVGGGGAAPKKVLRKCVFHGSVLLSGNESVTVGPVPARPRR